MRNDPSIPWALREQIDRELEAGERLEWAGMPVPRFFTAHSIAGFLFAIPWTAFAIFWTAGAAQATADSCGPRGFDFFPLFGVPFILVGVYLLLSPLWTYLKTRRTAYAITDRRALIFDGGWSTTIRSFRPHELRDLSRKERRNGRGDVVITRRVRPDGEGGQQTEDIGFLHVEQPREIEQKLRQLAAKTP